MSLLRKVALKISDAVVRWASPGCKEWAKGLEREVAFIESDWRALGWALGSMRVLFDRREAQLGSLEEASVAVESYFEKRLSQSSTAFWLTCAFLLALGVLIFLLPFHLMQRVALSSMLATQLYSVSIARASRPRELNHEIDLYERVAKYRSDLQLIRELQYGWKIWAFNLVNCAAWIILPVSGFVEISRSFPPPSFGLGIFTAAFVVVMLFGAVLQSYLSDHKNLRLIQELDALLAGRAEGAGL